MIKASKQQVELLHGSIKHLERQMAETQELLLENLNSMNTKLDTLKKRVEECDKDEFAPEDPESPDYLTGKYFVSVNDGSAVLSLFRVLGRSNSHKPPFLRVVSFVRENELEDLETHHDERDTLFECRVTEQIYKATDFKDENQFKEISEGEATRLLEEMFTPIAHYIDQAINIGNEETVKHGLVRTNY